MNDAKQKEVAPPPKNTSKQQQQQQPITYPTTNEVKKGRSICDRCKRPTPRACICAALPPTPITFSNCRVLILQHPHEIRRKNRSVPILELCIDNDDNGNSKVENNDFHLRVVVARRLGDQIDSNIMTLLRDPNEEFLLLFPSSDAMSMMEGMKLLEQRRIEQQQKQQQEEKQTEEEKGDKRNKKEKNPTKNSKVTVIFLDATWKYAKEMDQACSSRGLWPKHMIRIQLNPSSSSDNDNDCAISTLSESSSKQDISSKDEKQQKQKEALSNIGDDNSKDTTKGSALSSSTTMKTTTSSMVIPKEYIPHRFDIRTPPSSKHLSTAECVAWVVTFLENKPELYSILMKPLDLMVKKWHSFSDNRTPQNKRTLVDGDSVVEGTQPTLKSTSQSKNPNESTKHKIKRTKIM